MTHCLSHRDNLHTSCSRLQLALYSLTQHYKQLTLDTLTCFAVVFIQMCHIHQDILVVAIVTPQSHQVLLPRPISQLQQVT